MNRESPGPTQPVQEPVTPKRVSLNMESIGKRVSGALRQISGIRERDSFLQDPGSPLTERQKARERGEEGYVGEPATAVKTPTGDFVVMGDYVAPVPPGIDAKNYATGFAVGTPVTAKAHAKKSPENVAPPSARTPGRRDAMAHPIISLDKPPQNAPTPSPKTHPTHRQNRPPHQPHEARP